MMDALARILSALTLGGIYSAAILLAGIALLALLTPKADPANPALKRYSTAAVLGGAFALGQGVVGNFFMVMAAGGIFGVASIVTVLIVGSVSGVMLRRSVLSWQQIRADVRELWQIPLSWRIVALLIIALIALFLYMTFHPARGDAVAYYLTQAKLIAATGYYTPLADYEGFSQIGLGGEMHYAALYALDTGWIGEAAAKIQVWPTALASGLLMVAICEKLSIGPAGRWTALAILFTSTGASYVLWDGKSDLFPTALGLASVYWAISATSSRGAALLCGLMGGLAMIGKLSFVVVMCPILGLLLAWRAWTDFPNGSAARILRHAFLIPLAGGLLGVLPLVIKNALIFHEPFAPFLFLTPGATAVMLDQAWYSPEITSWIVKQYPLALTFGDYPMQYGVLSPLWLALAPLALLARRRFFSDAQGFVAVVSIAAVIAVLAWVIVRPAVLAPRYILPALLLLAIPGAFAVDKIAANSRLLRWSASGAVAFAVGLSLMALFWPIRILNSFPNAVAFTLGYLATPPGRWHEEIWASAEQINQHARSEDRVYAATYYTLPLDSRNLSCLMNPAEKSAILAQTTTTGIWSRMWAAGVDWITIFTPTHEGHFLAPLDPKMAPNYLSVSKTSYGNLYAVYHLEGHEGAPARETRCVQQRNGSYGPEVVTAGGDGASSQTTRGTQTAHEDVSHGQIIQGIIDFDTFLLEAEQLASQRATREDLKQLASQLGRQSREEAAALAAVTGAIGLGVPKSNVSLAKDPRLKQLASTEDGAFDAAYLSAATAENDALRLTAEGYFKSAPIGPLRAFVEGTLARRDAYAAALLELASR